MKQAADVPVRTSGYDVQGQLERKMRRDIEFGTNILSKVHVTRCNLHSWPPRQVPHYGNHT